MKKILLILVTLTTLYSHAGVYKNDHFFLECNNCSSDFDFRNTARLHFEQLHPYDPNMPLSGIEERYVLVNMAQGLFRTVRAQWKMQVASGPRGRTGGGTTIVQEVSLLPNSTLNNERFAEFLDGIDNFATAYQFASYQGSSASTTGYWNTLFLLSPTINWQGTANFATSVEAFVNAKLEQDDGNEVFDYNPFYFALSPMFVEVYSADGYYVTLVSQPAASAERKWNVFYVWKDNTYFDASGNQLGLRTSLPSNAACSTSGVFEVCRTMNSNHVSSGGVFERLVVANSLEGCGSDPQKTGCTPPTAGCPAGSTKCQPKRREEQ
ncbi:MAG: hypothetical protein HWE13_04605 [Gammaproteobacteria bacterium]|nr:hypothetical protein [Gammaproteobacteria bacterium]